EEPVMRHVLVLAFFTVATTMTFAQSSKQVFPNANASLPFSTAIKADGLIYVSGTLGSGGDVKAQTKQVLDNISAALKTAGSSLANAASMTVYLKNQSDFAAMNEVYRTYWTKDPPARTTVMVPLLNEGLVEISAVAVPDGGERVVVNPSDWMVSPNPYSYGIRSGNTLFLAGLISRNGKDNSTIKGDMKEQTKTVLDNAGAVLKAGGMTFADVVSSRIYVTDTAAFQDMNAVYRTYFPTDPPARATVKTALTSNDYVVEITMIAVRGPKTAITTPTEDGKPGTKNPNLSSAIRVGNRLYLSGILGNTPANTGDVKGQAAETMARIGRTLKAAGFDWSHLVEGMVYLPDLTKFADMNVSYREPIGKDFPARATVGAGLMNADGAVEIMFTAVK
ncbi:MAG TPA: RidA family protein, partial [Vicinamibacterales bacterium]|nr:RidA family protein [Vicinamibacterales bacterium]